MVFETLKKNLTDIFNRALTKKPKNAAVVGQKKQMQGLKSIPTKAVTGKVGNKTVNKVSRVGTIHKEPFCIDNYNHRRTPNTQNIVETLFIILPLIALIYMLSRARSTTTM